MLNAFDFTQEIDAKSRRLIRPERDCTGLPKKIVTQYEKKGTNAFRALGD
jgi:hypothetical protein